jgi:rubrerythrin
MIICGVLGIALCIAQLVRVRRQMRRARLHDGLVCPRCGYLLINHTDAEPCPECGERWTRAELDVFWAM